MRARENAHPVSARGEPADDRQDQVHVAAAMEHREDERLACYLARVHRTSSCAPQEKRQLREQKCARA
jgi:hypothetical protein